MVFFCFVLFFVAFSLFNLFCSSVSIDLPAVQFLWLEQRDRSLGIHTSEFIKPACIKYYLEDTLFVSIKQILNCCHDHTRLSLTHPTITLTRILNMDYISLHPPWHSITHSTDLITGTINRAHTIGHCLALSDVTDHLPATCLFTLIANSVTTSKLISSQLIHLWITVQSTCRSCHPVSTCLSCVCVCVLSRI